MDYTMITQWFGYGSLIFIIWPSCNDYAAVKQNCIMVTQIHWQLSPLVQQISTEWPHINLVPWWASPGKFSHGPASLDKNQDMSNSPPVSLNIRSIIQWRVFVLNLISLFVASHAIGSFLDVIFSQVAILMLDLISFKSQRLPMVGLAVETSHIPSQEHTLAHQHHQCCWDWVFSFCCHICNFQYVYQSPFLLDDHIKGYSRIMQIHQQLWRGLIHYLAKLRSRDWAADNMLKIELGDTVRLVWLDAHDSIPRWMRK